MNNLATIQKILSVQPHTNSDNLELATVLGWQVVVKKGEFKSGDLCVYIAIDSIVPDKPKFAFLKDKHFRIKPVRLRGQVSNGICFPLDILGSGYTFLNTDTPPYKEGEDVTDYLGVTKYEKPVPTQLVGISIGMMPSYVKVTDELNIRSSPTILDELKGKSYYISRKDDGSSGTFFLKDGAFNVCSRRVHLAYDNNNGFWKMASKYDIENHMRKYFDKDVAIQGEVVGPGIQKNPLGLKEMELHLFNIYNIYDRTYMGFDMLKDFCSYSGIPMVDVIETGNEFSYSLEGLLKIANFTMYPNSSPAEGIVIRSKEYIFSPTVGGYLGGKVLNEDYKE